MREEVYFNKVHGYHYAAVSPVYNLLIAHGIGGHGGTYDVFCEPLSARGADIYSLDLPGHGKARNERGNFRFVEWLEDIDEAARAVKQRNGLPVFVLGSSQGSAAAFHSLAFSDAVDGGITMGLYLNEVEPQPDTHSGRRHFSMRTAEAARIAETEGDTRRIDLATAIDWNKNYAKDDPDILAKKRQDPLRAWTYGFASVRSYVTYEPPIPAAKNSKPVLVTVGADDPLIPQAYVRRCFDAIGGPKRLEVVPKGTHQLMLYHTETYVPLVDTWIKEQLSGLLRKAG
ncbi:alpha/beta hydrolase [Bradyrhizobium manausense]